MKHFINYLSILAGRKFHKAYHTENDSRKTLGWLNVYIGLRKVLPKVRTFHDHNHMGNHYGSGYKPWKATQGI